MFCENRICEFIDKKKGMGVGIKSVLNLFKMDKRVKFDFEIYFTNGGNIKGEGFHLDILGDNISDKELANYIVADMRLLMVGQAKILNKEIIQEQHKRKPINENLTNDYLESVKSQFQYYKMLGEKTFTQLSDEHLFWKYNEDSNSIGIIVKHLWGNMLSRWTDFLTTDGEKEWRSRDAEFENDIATKDELLLKWNEGWRVFFDTLNSLTDEDLKKTIYIRNQGHTVLEAINRQLAHYPYHVGQIVFIGKLYAEKWNSLSIPKGNSDQYNVEKFSKPKEKRHFTEEYLSRDPDALL